MTLQLPNIADVVERVEPSVVAVVSRFVSRDMFGRESEQFGSGTGIIIDDQGHVLTNNHVIAGATNIIVTTYDNRQLEAEIIGGDPFTDVAVLKVASKDIQPASLGNSSRLRVGDWVIAIGNALALEGGPTVTLGVVSALGRNVDVTQGVTLYDLIQTDAIINPGNSGGPLLNLKGEVVGINSAGFRGTLPGGQEAEGIGFAIRIDTALPLAQQLIENGRVLWPWFGVRLGDLDPAAAARAGLPIRQGVVVGEAIRNGPAWKAGIRSGDILLALDDNKTPTVRELSRLLRQVFKVGDTVTAHVFREDREMNFQLTLGTRPVS